ncbi:hypothetical protein RAB80_004052 [Fusarium oxysporum f. sp. vasinfectum]|nr:hypothetical protein RAB80_004052 [Fusarium oxysporum f. sp. vasinfectum]
MGSDFLADINNNHAQECRMDWGPRFACGIKAITALGQLLVVTRLELDVSTLEIPGSYDSRGRLTTAGEKTTIGQTIQEIGISLASAIGGVRETHDSYRAVFERFINLKEEKIDRLHRTMSRISYTISMDEYHHCNSTTDQQLRDSKDVAELRELAIELRLTFYIMFDWSSLYTRISQDIFTPALGEVQSFSSLSTLISSIDLSSDRLKLRPAQQGQPTPRQNASLFCRSSMPITTIPPAYSEGSNISFSQSSVSMAKDKLTLHKVAEFAEIELNKLYRSEKRDEICTRESDGGLYHNYADRNQRTQRRTKAYLE